jgi:UDP-N-acetylmuramoyl-L-alanyl-D-glutamate--2,6-diaminopimelate ligase
VPWEAILDGIRKTRLVEGRFEKVDLGQDFLCIIDYAHTEDALRKLILAAREMTPGRVITVFGCGGDRDRGKRPAMGSCASELSDEVFITSDNPRGEDPVEIIKEITTGMKSNNYRIVPDRAEAIREAVMAANTSDTVIIAGKGHEDYQEIKGTRRRFSDSETAGAAIKERASRK